MSGGSWDYVYSRMEEAAERLAVSKCPHRRAFGLLMTKCAKAMYGIEWVDSCDMSKGDELPAIHAALSGIDVSEVAVAFRDELREMADNIDAMLRQFDKSKEGA